MDYTDFVELGFNENEAKVYVALIKRGSADASQLIEDTKFHKNIVYDNLSRLVDRGLATYVRKEGRRVYKLAPADRLVQNMEDRIEDLREEKEEAEELADEIEQTKAKKPVSQEAEIFKGKNAIRNYLHTTLEKDDFVVFGAPEKSLEIMGEVFWKKYTQKLQRNDISARLVFNPRLKEYGEEIESSNLDIRYFERDFDPLTETRIHGEEVAIVVWTEEPVLFLIRDRHVAEAYREHFEQMWSQAEEA